MEPKRKVGEAAKDAIDTAQGVATRVVNAADETVMKAFHRVKEAANTAEHRRQELAEKRRNKRSTTN